MFTKSWLRSFIAIGHSLLLGPWSCASLPAVIDPIDATGPINAASEAEVVADTALFAALIRTLSDSLPEPRKILHTGPNSFRVSSDPLRVDPRPLTSTVHFGPARLAAVPSKVVAARAAVLARLGIPEVDAVGSRHCPSWTVLASASPKERERLGSGCPKEEAFLTVIAGIPRFGQAAWSQHPEAAAEEARLGHWSIMVIEVPLTPTGVATTFVDYVFKRTDGGAGWLFVKRKGLFDVD
jgi:hypothetical protein